MRLLTLMALFGLASSAWTQTTWYVDVQNPGPGSGTQADPYSSLQFALSRPSTVSGDTVLVLPGVYPERIDFLGKNVLVQSTAGAAATELDAQGSPGSVVSFVNGEGPGAVLDGFSVRHGTGTMYQVQLYGGGVFCSGSSPTLRNLIVRDNTAYFGYGTAFVASSAASIDDCLIESNTSLCYCGGMSGGGIFADNTSPIVVEDTMIRNHNTGFWPVNGGGIYGRGTYTRCTIRNNFALRGAGANGQLLNLIDCVIQDNFAVSFDADPGTGGGVFQVGMLTNCIIRNNRADVAAGGAMLSTLVGCTIENNVSNGVAFTLLDTRGGGALECTLTDCVIRGNRLGSVAITHNAGAGGGISGGTATRCRIENNSLFVGNAPGGLLGGGGAFNSVLIDCDVLSNTITTNVVNPTLVIGGAGVARGSATRTRIVGNTTTRIGGGALDTSLTHCTVYGNTATLSGGAVHATTPIAVTNTILWSNGATPVTTSGSGSVGITYSDVEGGFAGTGNFNADPLLLAPPFDVHLRPNSPCIDAGNPAGPFDPDFSRPDVGAFYFECGAAYSYGVGKLNTLGCTPTTGASGVASITGPDNFFVTGASFRNQNAGRMFWGRGATAVPFLGGTRYVQNPLVRTPIQFAGGSTPPTQDCSGTYSFHFSHAYMSTVAIQAGDSIYCQWLGRDAPSTFGTSLSNGIAFTVCP